MAIINLGSRSLKIAIFVVLLMIGVGTWALVKPTTVKGPIYSESVVQRRDIATKIEATGTVQPENRLEIKPPVAGRIDEVLVREGDRVKKGSVLAWMSSTERAALLDAAASQGSEEVKNWKEIYKATPILAPISGTIISRKVESGQSFTLQDPILVMADRLLIKATLDETDLAQIKKSQAARILLDAYANDPIEGVVSAIAYEATKVNNVTTYQVSVLPKSTPDYLRSGMTASIDFIGETKTQVITVPTEAIRFKEGKSLVLFGDQQSPTEKEIVTGKSDGKFTEVISGLNESEVIYLENLDLKDKTEGGNPFMPTRFRKKKSN
jgi:macrolide-specific efflux system membrane fusion protein